MDSIEIEDEKDTKINMTSSGAEETDDEVTDDQKSSSTDDQDEEELDKNPQRFFPGDLAVLKLRKSIDLSPQYGTVIGIYHPDFIDENCDPNIFCEPSTTDFYVQWQGKSGSKITKVKGKEVGLVDRLLTIGSRVKNDEGETGTVVQQQLQTTLQLVGTNHVIDNVPLSELRPITIWIRQNPSKSCNLHFLSKTFARGLEIIFENWVGIIEGIQKCTWYRLDGGMTFFVTSYEADPFFKADPYWGIGSSCPGMKISCNRTLLKKARWSSAPMRFLWKWLPGVTLLYSMAQATITRIETTGIKVKWLDPTPWAKPSAQKPAMTFLTDGDLQKVDVIGRPSLDTLGINSVRIYKLKPKDQITSYTAWYNGFQARFMGEDPNEVKSFTSFAPASNTPALSSLTSKGEFDVPVKIILRQSLVDIEWMNGRRETMRAAALPYIFHDLENEEFPAGLVIAPLFIQTEADKKRYGIVQSNEEFVKSDVKMIRVRWFLMGDEITYDLGLKDESIYDVVNHNSLSLYQRGTIVLAKNPKVDGFKAGVVSEIDVRNGKMILMFADGSTHSTYPHVVTPLKKRCVWNFFKNCWIIDDIVPPPHHILSESEEVAKKKEIEAELRSIAEQVEQQTTSSTKSSKARAINNNNNFDWVSVSQEDSIWNKTSFDMLEHFSEKHSFAQKFPANIMDHKFIEFLLHEQKILHKDTPEGIWIKTYSDRMDLFSTLMIGPENTPYEDSIFIFDIQLYGFPNVSPRIKYISYSGDISPAMASDGNFCLHLLDLAHDEKPKSYILNLLEQIRVLIFKSEPLLILLDNDENLANDEKLKEKSRAYNEMVFLRCLEGAYNMVKKPHDPWRSHIYSHHSSMLAEKFNMLEKWLKYDAVLKSIPNQDKSKVPTPTQQPNYPLLPISPGFRIALLSRLAKIHAILPPGAIDLDSISSAVINETSTTSLAEELDNNQMDESRSMTTVVSLEGAAIRSNEKIDKLPEIITSQ